MHAASAEVGVAISALLPQFNITAAPAFTTGGPFWNVAAEVTQPLFDGCAVPAKAGNTPLRQTTAAKPLL